MKNKISNLLNYTVSNHEAYSLKGGTDSGSGSYAGVAREDVDLQGHGTHCAG